MDKRRYPLVISMRGGIHQHANIPRSPLYGVFLGFVICGASWFLSGSARTALISLVVVAIVFGIAMFPHVLATTSSLLLKILASVIVGIMAIAGVVAAITIIYFWASTRPGTGMEMYFIGFFGFATAAVLLWFSYAYAYQIHYHWKTKLTTNDRLS